MASQKEIFNDKVPELIIKKPKDEDFLYYCNFLDTIYTSDSLSDIVYTFKSLYYGKTVYELNEKTGKKVLSSIVSKIQTGKTIRKFDKVQFVALFISNKENLALYCDAMPDEIKALWREIYSVGFVSNDKVNSILGYDGIIKTGYFSSSISVHPKLSFFNTAKGKTGNIGMYNYPEQTFFLILNPNIYKLFYPFFYKREYGEINKSWTPESDEKLNIFKGEMAFVRELPLMCNLQKQNILHLGDSKKISVTLVKKVSQQIGTEEFFPSAKEPELARLRSVLLFNIFTSYVELDYYGKIDENPTVSKEIVDSLFYRNQIIMACMFPHISGFKHAYFNESYLEDILTNLLIFFVEQTEDRWFDIEEIIDFLSYKTDGYVFRVFNIYALEKQNLVNKRTGKLLGLQQLADNLGKPLIKTFVLLFSSLGLLDVAYRDYSEDDISYVDWVKYCRITNLGKYVFGKVKKYEPEVVIEDKKYFELDSDRLIIKSVEKENPYEKLLLDIAESIGNTRYKMSCASFLRSCKDMNDVSGKIDFFKKFISDEWSETWKSFFDTLMMKCNPLSSIPSDNYLIYKLDSANKELIQLLVSDKILKENVIKAEGYMVLISKNNKKKVFDRLKELGYMM